ncbi:hypothetical protein SAMN04488109_4843 [Chryseolinea serpens]|uniref:Uncharacterized protein n=2 Tax=Chryseolinea serpens TaxID=947013 RepID=A0A1M5UQT8_9BACT|nr:hypothetical protein SAMN04488109_4843 [Chryseolinea serpens]
MRLKNHGRLIIIFAFLSACHTPKPGETKMLDFGQFTITVPATWDPVKVRGIDSYVGLIALGEEDTINFDLGWYSNALDEDKKFMIQNGDFYVLDSVSSDGAANFMFYGKADTVNVENFLENKITWTTVDGRKAKIISPKRTGQGLTGIYIDSVWMAGSARDRFQMNGRNLNAENERLLLKAFETLRFKKIAK